MFNTNLNKTQQTNQTLQKLKTIIANITETAKMIGESLLAAMGTHSQQYANNAALNRETNGIGAAVLDIIHKNNQEKEKQEKIKHYNQQ